MDIIFNKIIYKDIFTRDFDPLASYNRLNFTAAEEMVVIYGPNGTGKTSLVNVLGGAANSTVNFTLNDAIYASTENTFHIIKDQNNRNIISGETKDFFLGDNIKREYELLELLKVERNNIISAIISTLKTYGITSSSTPLLEAVMNDGLLAFIKDCANSKSKGNNFTNDQIVDLIKDFSKVEVQQYEEEKMRYFQSDYADKKSIFKQLAKLLGEEIEPNTKVKVIEENTEAIKILSRFVKNNCIVCDNENINREALLQSKKTNRENTINALNEKVRTIIETIINYIPEQDPFDIKMNLLNAVELGDISQISVLVDESLQYKQIFGRLLHNDLQNLFDGHAIIEVYTEYQRIIADRPDITDEDYLYIREIIGNSMDKNLTVERDENKVLRIKISDQEFLGKNRNELPLSNGEQNFLSLSFEFLKAKNSSCPIIVIDDPVSSFDSIYKNKVVYAIVKMLHDKKRIVLTHNTDLIRLLQGQYKNCFKLYLLNNTDGETNGFIPLNNKEKDMLINLEQLLTEFRTEIPKNVISTSKELFLISMIPFMRGYAKIINKKDIADNLTMLMHGYKTDIVDIGNAYTELFGNHEEYLPTSYEISVPDILSKTVEGVKLIDRTKYPLLDKTLRHSFTYLFLRLLVEKNLVEKYNIDTNRHKQLGQIISAAYPDDNDVTQVRNRIRLTAKKTLINEFNHFEGNLSIFQPAIDITDHALGKERTDITAFIDSLE
ncbi:MAG: hypothetical protein RR967_03360 [Anaerovoracaceae bacterium]